MANISVGIVGLPNVGKSTLFNALVKNSQAVASNYPFCTIEPNVGIVEVPDPRLQQLADLVHPQQIVPAVVEFVDIAGIIRGAAQGEGLGNKFLSHIRETAAVILLVRCFEHPDVTHVQGRIDPRADLETIRYELALADLETVQRAQERYRKAAKGGDATAAACLAYAEKLYAALEKTDPASSVPPQNDNDHLVLRELQLLTTKPALIVANIDEKQLALSPEELLRRFDLSEYAATHTFIPMCAQLEAELQSIPEEEKAEFLRSYGIAESGLHRLAQAAYALLNLQTYFTAGPKEVRAWTIGRGWRAPQAAGVIHTDFEKGFIKAEVITFEDYIRYGSETACREAGKARVEGKDYVVRDGDVMHFRFSQ
jgi:GTP-binding protein YchF